ncbi:MAG: DNA translocase FtsK 4TM domain-containing protein, partial [Candidatus Ornithomonoglobus sp.]
MAAKKSSNNTSKKTTKKRTAMPPEPVKENSLLNPLFIHGVIWSVMIAATLISMYIDTDAIIPVAVKSTCGGLFGIMAYVLPAIFIGTLIYLVNTKSIGKMWQKFILLFLEMTDICALIGLFADYDADSAYSICSAYTNGGGAVGVAIAQGLSGFISSIGAFLVLIVLFVVIGCLIAKFNIVPYIIGGIKHFMGFSSDTVERVRENAERRREARETNSDEPDDDEYYEPEENKRKAKGRRLKHDLADDDSIPEGLAKRRMKKQESSRDKAYTGSPMDIAKDFAIDLEHNNGVQNGDILNDGYDYDKEFDLYNMRFDDVNMPASDDSVGTTGSFDPLREQPAAEEEPVRTKRKKTAMKPTDEEPENSGSFDESIFNTYSDDPVPVDEDIMDNYGEAAATEEKKPKEKKLSEKEKDSFIAELDDAMAEEHYEYQYPSLDLLDTAKRVSNDQRQELYKKAEQLIAVLDNFGVKAKPVQVTQGPTVTRYEIQPGTGVKVSSITK